MTEKPKIILFKDAYPLCWEANLIGTCESKDIEQALTVAREQGKLEQYTETINLFNKLRNGRFQFNDEVKMVIDMLKDEMTRLKSQLKTEKEVDKHGKKV